MRRSSRILHQPMDAFAVVALGGRRRTGRRRDGDPGDHPQDAHRADDLKRESPTPDFVGQ